MNITALLIIRLFIGILFLASGASKILDSQAFAQLVNQYGLGWAAYLTPAISGVEVIAGMLLLLNIRPGKTALVTGVLTIIFTFAFAYAYFFKGIEDCGCMGKFIELPPWVSFLRNIAVIAGSYFVWKKTDNTQAQIPSWKYVIVYVIGSISFGLAGFSLAKPIIDVNHVELGESVNTNFLRYYASSLSEGRSFIFIFSPDCGHCWNMTENVKSIKSMPEFSRVIGLTYPGTNLNSYYQEMKPNFEIIRYPTNEIYDVVGSVPLLLMVENGKIARIYKDHDIPCGPMLNASLKN